VRKPNLMVAPDEQRVPSEERLDGQLVAGETDTAQATDAQEGQDEYDEPAENLLNAPDSNRKGNHVETPRTSAR